MNMQRFLTQVQHALRDSTWQQIVLLFSLGLNLILAGLAWQREIVIHLPPAASSESLIIANASVNQEAKIAHGLYLAGLLGNVSRDNAAFIESAVGRFVTPRAFRTYLAELKQQAEKIRDEQLTTHFQAMEAAYDPGTDLVSVAGLLVTRGVTTAEQRDYRTFRFRFVTRHHQTLLDELEIKDERTRLTAGS